MNSNILIGYPNRADSATYSGGDWAAGLPASNLASRELWKVARTSDCLLASTKFNVAIPSAQKLRLFSIHNHNLSDAATWRVTIGTTAGASDVWDSSWKPVWTMPFSEAVAWGSSVWWLKPGGDEFLRSPFCSVIVAPDAFNARFITVEINDTANVDGYVQIGRVFAGGVIQPEYNAAYGLQDAWRDLSSVDLAESGAMWATERRRMRSVSFVLPYIPSDEANYWHELQRQVGTVGEVVYVPYPSDLATNQRYGFLGRLSELSPIEYPYYRVRSLALKIEELA